MLLRPDNNCLPYLKALSDESRWSIVRSLVPLPGPLTLGDLAARLGISDYNTVLLGIDKNIEFLGRNLNLNAYLVQIRDGDGWMPAVGFKYDVCKNVVFETWTNLPDEGKAEFMLKLNYVFTY